jgi:serine/threonine protein kinase
MKTPETQDAHGTDRQIPGRQGTGQGGDGYGLPLREPGFRSPVAVKVIRFGKDCAAMSRRLRKLFQNEGMVARRLNHPNIAKVYEGVVEDDYAYLAMEYIQGFPLEGTPGSTSCCRCTG